MSRLALSVITKSPPARVFVALPTRTLAEWGRSCGLVAGAFLTNTVGTDLAPRISLGSRDHFRRRCAQPGARMASGEALWACVSSSPTRAGGCRRASTSQQSDAASPVGIRGTWMGQPYAGHGLDYRRLARRFCRSVMSSRAQAAPVSRRLPAAQRPSRPVWPGRFHEKAWRGQYPADHGHWAEPSCLFASAAPRFTTLS